MSEREHRGHFEVFVHGPYSEDVLMRLTEAVIGMEPNMYYSSLRSSLYTDEIKPPKVEEKKKDKNDS